MKKLTINLPVLLPDIPDVEDRCVTQLIGTLEGREGIHRVHVKMDDEEMSPLLCIHFDPDVISLRHIKHIARQTGATPGHVRPPAGGSQRHSPSAPCPFHYQKTGKNSWYGRCLRRSYRLDPAGV